MIQAKKAVRQKVKVKAALIGPSGSGKTYSALRMARGVGGKILLINTEADRGYLYADEFDYDIVDLIPPFAPEKYIEAIDYGEKEGYDIIILDSGSHEWSGRGGLLEIHDNMPGNSYTNWGKVTPRHNAFIDKQLYSKCHIINCLRGKDQYAMDEDEKGSKKVKKLGMGPEQRANYEYEFMVTFMIDQQTHVASVMKDNTHLFENKYDILTEEHGKRLLQWANSGAEASALSKPEASPAGQSIAPESMGGAEYGVVGGPNTKFEQDFGKDVNDAVNSATEAQECSVCHKPISKVLYDSTKAQYKVPLCTKQSCKDAVKQVS